MGLFSRFCRDVGLMIHNIAKPDHERRIVNKRVDEEKRGKVTLRRTTIEEIEIDGDSRPGDKQDGGRTDP